MSYYAKRAGRRPSKAILDKLEWIKTTHGVMPEQYVRKLIKKKYAVTRIASELGIRRDSLRFFMFHHGIEPCPNPDYFAAPDHRDNLKLAGRRRSPKNNFMVDGRPFVELMAERGHVPETPVYTRTRRRMSWGMDFETAYRDAIQGPRNSKHGRPQ